MFPCFGRNNIVVHRECGEIIGGKTFVFVIVTVISTSYCKITLTNTPDGSIGSVVTAGM